MSFKSLLERLERYYDTAPRANTTVEEIGPFTLFIARGSWPYYARPRLFCPGPFTVAHFRAVLARQRALGVARTFEWVNEVTPGLVEVARTTGLSVREHPLMVLSSAITVQPPPGVRLRRLEARDPAIPATQTAIMLGFQNAGTALGPVGPAARDKALAGADPRTHDGLHDQLARGLLGMIVAEDANGPIAGGTFIPRGDVCELTGIATLPFARRKGIGAAVTAALVAAAHSQSVETVFLSAADDDIARVYSHAGFQQIATACIAEDPAD